jgi:D-amino-acid dehydrogenase
MGHRPAMPDSLPVIGPSQASPDVIYAFGHGHVGMTAAPMTGKIVADLLAGRPPSIDIAPFAAARFA